MTVSWSRRRASPAGCTRCSWTSTPTWSRWSSCRRRRCRPRRPARCCPERIPHAQAACNSGRSALLVRGRDPSPRAPAAGHPRVAAPGAAARVLPGDHGAGGHAAGAAAMPPSCPAPVRACSCWPPRPRAGRCGPSSTSGSWHVLEPGMPSTGASVQACYIEGAAGGDRRASCDIATAALTTTRAQRHVAYDALRGARGSLLVRFLLIHIPGPGFFPDRIRGGRILRDRHHRLSPRHPPPTSLPAAVAGSPPCGWPSCRGWPAAWASAAPPRCARVTWSPRSAPARAAARPLRLPWPPRRARRPGPRAPLARRPPRRRRRSPPRRRPGVLPGPPAAPVARPARPTRPRVGRSRRPPRQRHPGRPGHAGRPEPRTCARRARGSGQERAPRPSEPRGERGQRRAGRAGRGEPLAGAGVATTARTPAPTGRASTADTGATGRTTGATTARTAGATTAPERRGDRADNRGESRADRSDNRSEDRGDGADNRGDDRGDRSDNRSDNRRQPEHGRSTTGATAGRATTATTAARGNEGDDDERGGRRRNRQRSRDRKRGGTRREGEGYGSGGYGSGSEQAETIHDDDVLIPVAGILDVLDNYAFVRTSATCPARTTSTCRSAWSRRTACARVTPSPVRSRRSPRASSRRPAQKFNALVRLDTVNGKTPEESREPGGVRQADAALPAGAAAARDRAEHPLDAPDRPHRARSARGSAV